MHNSDNHYAHNRAPTGYEPTPKGKRLLQELSKMLPRLDRLLSGEDFDPQAEETTFRVAVTDHASHVLCPLICRMVLPGASRVSIEFVSFGVRVFAKSGAAKRTCLYARP